MNSTDNPTVSSRNRIASAPVADIKVGQPLPFSVYDRYDNLLLRKGFIITSERQRDRLLEQGVFRHLPDSRYANSDEVLDEFQIANRFTVVETIEILLDRLDRAYQLLRSEQRHQYPYLCLGIVNDLQRICNDNPDAILAGMQISHHLPYGLIHPLHCGVLCELLGKRLNVPLMKRVALVAGAISHDVGICQLQEKLHRQTTPLTDNQWQRIQRHPNDSAELLRQAGVDDPIWLDVVAQHHERLDGSGYPAALNGNQIRPESRILSIADIYTAMIRPRAYRDAFVAKDALRNLFKDRGATVDPQLVELFVRSIGVFPPGAFVRLANGETAVIQKRGAEASRPVCYSVIGRYGDPLPQPLLRDTSEPLYAVLEMLPHHDHPSLQSHFNDLWPPLRAIAEH